MISKHEDIKQMQVKDGKKIYQETIKQNKDIIAIFTAAKKIDIKAERVPSYKEVHYIMIKGSFHQENKIMQY